MSFPSRARETDKILLRCSPPYARHFIKKRMAINLLHFRLSRTKANKNCFKKLSLRHIGNFLPLSFVRISSRETDIVHRRRIFRDWRHKWRNYSTDNAQSFKTLIFKEFFTIFWPHTVNLYPKYFYIYVDPHLSAFSHIIRHFSNLKLFFWRDKIYM